MNNLRNIEIERIHRRADARHRDDAALTALEQSIAEVGLISPIRVRQIGENVYEVVAGSHRLQACELLGWETIPALVEQLDDLHAELKMIDENLVRAELSPAERAKQTFRRKEIYESLYPETQHGTPGVSRQVGDTRERGSAERFTANTAAASGRSERAVQRDAERGEYVDPAALDIISGTKADKGAVIERLMSVPRKEQFEAARREVEAKEAARPAGGIASRYSTAFATKAAPAELFAKFIKLADEMEAITVADLIAGAGRQRAVLGSGPIDLN